MQSCLTLVNITLNTSSQHSNYLFFHFSPNAGAEVVKKIRKDAETATAWCKDVGELIKSGKKITFDDAVAKLGQVSKVNFTSSEFKTLRGGLKNARSWANRVKKCRLDEGGTHVNDIKALVDEHDTFLVTLPDKIEALKEATRGYCICRRPYEGFMIGCDECEEWYHGACIGLTEAQADKLEKFVCIRCSIKKMYITSSNTIAAVIRKWCDPKELSKARSYENQKHQRKVREVKKEMNKWKLLLDENNAKLNALHRSMHGGLAVDPSGNLLNVNPDPTHNLAHATGLNNVDDESFKSRDKGE